MPRLYQYVGPKAIAERAQSAPAGVRVESPDDVCRWLRLSGQVADAAGYVIATFVIDETGWLRIADRRSEHVACAGSRPAQSAGEITFHINRGKVSVTGVTNQSTGYCPEPESWPAVETALERADFVPPDGFTPAFDFRRCPLCGSINLVKDGNFECEVCSTPLPVEWNLVNMESFGA